MKSPDHAAKRGGVPRNPAPARPVREGAVARSGKIENLLNWIKSNSIVATVIALTSLATPVVAFVGQTSDLMPVVRKTLNIPDCYRYSDVYYDKFSYFKRDGQLWEEIPRDSGDNSYEFREVHRTRDEIELVNLTERPEMPEWKLMSVSLPVCGGTARYSIGVPDHWVDMYEVWTDDGTAVASSERH